MLGIARTSVFNKEEITKTNAWLESLPPAEQPTELLKWAHKTIAANTWVQFTSFGVCVSLIVPAPRARWAWPTLLGPRLRCFSMPL